MSSVEEHSGNDTAEDEEERGELEESEFPSNLMIEIVESSSKVYDLYHWLVKKGHDSEAYFLKKVLTTKKDNIC